MYYNVLYWVAIIQTDVSIKLSNMKCFVKSLWTQEMKGDLVIVVVCVTKQKAPFKQCTIPLASKWVQKVHHGRAMFRALATIQLKKSSTTLSTTNPWSWEAFVKYVYSNDTP